MSNYQMKTKEYVSRFDYETQQKAVVAIQDLLDLGKDWEWIYTALRKKSVGE